MGEYLQIRAVCPPTVGAVHSGTRTWSSERHCVARSSCSDRPQWSHGEANGLDGTVHVKSGRDGCSADFGGNLPHGKLGSAVNPQNVVLARPDEHIQTSDAHAVRKGNRSCWCESRGMVRMKFTVDATKTTRETGAAATTRARIRWTVERSQTGHQNLHKNQASSNSLLGTLQLEAWPNNVERTC